MRRLCPQSPSPACRLLIAAALLRPAGPRLIDEHLPHGLRCARQEVFPIGGRIGPRDLHPGLMHERRGLQGDGPLVAEARRGHSPELLVGLLAECVHGHSVAQPSAPGERDPPSR